MRVVEHLIIKLLEKTPFIEANIIVMHKMSRISTFGGEHYKTTERAFVVLVATVGNH